MKKFNKFVPADTDEGLHFIDEDGETVPMLDALRDSRAFIFTLPKDMKPVYGKDIYMMTWESSEHAEGDSFVLISKDQARYYADKASVKVNRWERFK